MSDLAFNSTTRTYEPNQPTFNELSDVAYSGYLDLSVATPATTISSSLATPGAMPTDVTVLQALGIEFYQKVGANYYQFSSGNCLKIVDAF